MVNKSPKYIHEYANTEPSRLERTVMDLAKGVTSAGYWKLPAENAAGEILDLAKALIAAIDEEEGK